MMLIPKDYFDSKYYQEISKYFLASQLSLLLIGEAVENSIATQVTKGTFLDVDDYVRRVYGDKITSDRKDTAKKGAKKLKELGMLEDYHFEDNCIVCSFSDDFYNKVLKGNL